MVCSIYFLFSKIREFNLRRRSRFSGDPAIACDTGTPSGGALVGTLISNELSLLKLPRCYLSINSGNLPFGLPQRNYGINILPAHDRSPVIRITLYRYEKQQNNDAHARESIALNGGTYATTAPSFHRYFFQEIRWRSDEALAGAIHSLSSCVAPYGGKRGRVVR